MALEQEPHLEVVIPEVLNTCIWEQAFMCCWEGRESGCFLLGLFTSYQVAWHRPLKVLGNKKLIRTW